jgi:VanZ family protein
MSLFTPKLGPVFRLALVLALVAINWQALTPTPVPLPTDQFIEGDKLIHACAFFALAFLIDGAWPARRLGWRVLVLLTAYGAAIELAQGYVAYRDSSLLDLAADVSGLLLYAGLIGPWLRRHCSGGHQT